MKITTRLIHRLEQLSCLNEHHQKRERKRKNKRNQKRERKLFNKALRKVKRRLYAGESITNEKRLAILSEISKSPAVHVIETDFTRYLEQLSCLGERHKKREREIAREKLEHTREIERDERKIASGIAEEDIFMTAQLEVNKRLKAGETITNEKRLAILHVHM